MGIGRGRLLVKTTVSPHLRGTAILSSGLDCSLFVARLGINGHGLDRSFRVSKSHSIPSFRKLMKLTFFKVDSISTPASFQPQFHFNFAQLCTVISQIDNSFDFHKQLQPMTRCRWSMPSESWFHVFLLPRPSCRNSNLRLQIPSPSYLAHHVWRKKDTTQYACICSYTHIVSKVS